MVAAFARRAHPVHVDGIHVFPGLIPHHSLPSFPHALCLPFSSHFDRHSPHKGCLHDRSRYLFIHSFIHNYNHVSTSPFLAASCSKEIIGKLVEAGMNIARLNLSHCTQEFASEVISNIRSYLEESGSTAEVAIWLDINGPKVRTGRLVNGEPVQVIAGDDFYFVNDPELLGDNTKVGGMDLTRCFGACELMQANALDFDELYQGVGKSWG